MVIKFQWIQYPENRKLTYLNKISRAISIAIGLSLLFCGTTFILVEGVEDIEADSIFRLGIFIIIGILLVFVFPNFIDKWTNKMYLKSKMSKK